MKANAMLLLLLIFCIKINADWKLLGLEKDTVLCIAFDNSGKIIAGTKSSGIKIYTGKEWLDIKTLHIPVNKILFTQKSRFIAAIGNGSNSDGVYSVDSIDGPPYYKLSNLPIYGLMYASSLAKTENSDTIYMGGANTIVSGTLDTASGNYAKFTTKKTPSNPFGIEKPTCAALYVYRHEKNRLYAGGYDASPKPGPGHLLWMTEVKDSMSINSTINVTSLSEGLKDDGGFLLLIGTKDSIIYYCCPQMSVTTAKFFTKSPYNEPINDMVTAHIISIMRDLHCVAVKSGVYAAPLLRPWSKVGNIPAPPLCLTGLLIDIMNAQGRIVSLYAGTTQGVFHYDSSNVLIKNQSEYHFLTGFSIQQYKGNSIAVSFKLPQSENVHLDLLDCSGKNTVRIFVGYLNAGENTIPLHANNTAKNICLANGVYLLRLTAGKETVVRRFLFIG